jgi:hypothetical protein
MRREVEQHQKEIETVMALLGETLDGLLRCPPDRVEASAQEASRELRSHAEGALKELETIDELRGLTTEEQAQRRAFERFRHDQERADARASLV